MSSLGGHRRSGASGNHESGDSMGHGGFGVSVSNGGKLLPRKFLRNSTTSRGQSGGANVKGHSGGAGSRGRSQSAKLDGSERPLRAPGTERALERPLRAPGTERALERTLRAPGTERALERTLRAPETERALERTLRAPGTEWALERTLRAPGTERALERTMRAPSGQSGLWSRLCELLGRSGQCCGPGDASCSHRHQGCVQHTSNQSWPKRCICRLGGHLGRGLRRGRHDASRPWLGRHDVSRLWLGRHVVRLWGLMVRCCLHHLVRALWCVHHHMSECGVVFLLRNTHSKRRARKQQSMFHKAPQTALKLSSRKQRFDVSIEAEMKHVLE